jgi:collagenase-like PrtC family protease
MKAIDDSKTIGVNKELESRFKEERTNWNNDIIELVKCLGNTTKLSEAQVTQLSYRQIIQDKLAEYRILKEKREETYDKLCQVRAREYTTGSEVKLTNAEKNKYASNDHAAMKQQVQMIGTQITYLEECVKTLDNLGFAIKNKIEIISQQLF